ncbi:MAG: nitroreductase family protein [Flavobacteriales bacterium]|nr:nitroreductase family protein [Flavobacteriales bacterium]
MESHAFIAAPRQHFSAEETSARSTAFFGLMQKRRSIRDFASTPIAQGVIDHLISTAGTAPSGANKQPWTFCVVTNPQMKAAIRQAAEQEEKINYDSRMGERWLRDLAPLGTGWEKPFLEDAPALIVVFKRLYEFDNEGDKLPNYYVNESVGIACGMLLTAAHHAGLATLTHTPSPMSFLERMLNRPANERAYLLIPIGYPAEGALVPDIGRKSIEDIRVNYD